jgi:hypothetical protein
MGDVVDFPAPDENIERMVREALRGAGADQAMIDWIRADFRPRYEGLKSNAELPPAPIECAALINAAIHFFQERVHHAVVQMLLIEIELYQAKFDAPPIDPSKARLRIVRPDD